MRNRTMIFLLGAAALLSFPQGAGAQWDQAKAPKGGWITSLAVSGTNLFAGTYVAGRVFLSKNNGGWWANVSEGLPGPMSFSLSALVTSGANLFLGSFRGAYLTRDNGATWTAINQGLPKEPSIYCLAASDTDLFAGTEDGKVWRLPLAEDSLKKAQSSDPDHPETSAFEDEIALYKQVLSLLPDNAETWEKLGECYVKIGNDKDAMAAYKKVVKLKPDNAEAWYALGGCYEKAGRKEDAGKAFDRAKKLKPELFKK